MGVLLFITAVVAIAVALGFRARILASEELLDVLVARLARPTVPKCRVVQRDMRG